MERFSLNFFNSPRKTANTLPDGDDGDNDDDDDNDDASGGGGSPPTGYELLSEQDLPSPSPSPVAFPLTTPGAAPVLEQLLSHPGITDICLNGVTALYWDAGQGFQALPTDALPWKNESDLLQWILSQLSLVGKTWDAQHPFVDATLVSGHRVHVSFPPLSPQGILISLRRLGMHQKLSYWKQHPAFGQLAQAAQNGDSILISGATGSGKTTFIAELISSLSPLERIIALEDTSELFPQHPHFLKLISRPPNADGFGEITLRTLLKQTLRMRPDRIILGECRGEEVLDLLQALNTGHRGTLTTLHANSPRDALRRLELLCLLSSQGHLPLSALKDLLSHGLQWVVQLQRHHGKRVISEISRVEGREGDNILLRSIPLSSTLPSAPG